jgi:hypothetical protein
MKSVTMKQAVGRDIARVLVVVGLVLLVPLVAMQFTNEVVWGVLDFVVAGTLLVGTGLAYVFFANAVALRWQRIAIGLALAVALSLVWAELAVGIFGSPLAGT